MSTFPVELARSDSSELKIVWSDGTNQSISYRLLRDRCPCATCRDTSSETEDTNPLRVLSAAETIPLSIVKMMPVGNYAYNIQFSDGHDTGIFTFDFLRSLTDDGTG